MQSETLQKYLLFLCWILLLTTCALWISRYSTNMQTEKDLPADLSTAHEVILTQSAFIQEMSAKNERLARELEEAQAAFKRLLAGNRREQFINPDQKLLEFPEDQELQAALELAKRQAEEEIETITYTRTKKKEDAKPRSNSFPAHLRRVEIKVEISPLTQKLVDEGKLVLIGYEPSEVLCHVPPDTFVKRFLEPSLAKLKLLR